MSLKGSLREIEPGVWQLRVGAGRDPRTGNYRVLNRTVRGSRRQANRALQDLIADIGAGVAASGKAGTFAEHAERWQRHNRTRLSPTTCNGYELALRRRILPVVGAKLLHRVTTADVDDILTRMHQQGLSASTQRGTLRCIARCLEQGVLWGDLERNVAKRATKPAPRKPQLTPPSPADIQRVIAELERTGKSGIEGVAAVRLLAATGARRGEVCAVRWSHVDFNARKVSIDGAIVVDSVKGRQAKIVHRQPKTEASTRVVAIDDTTMSMLASVRVLQASNAEAMGVDLVDDPYVFAGDVSGARSWHPDRVSQIWQRAATRAGVKARLHDLRHAQATQLLAAGIDVRTVAGRLGHADPSMTLRVYASVLVERDEAAADIIGTLLS